MAYPTKREEITSDLITHKLVIKGKIKPTRWVAGVLIRTFLIRTLMRTKKIWLTS